MGPPRFNPSSFDGMYILFIWVRGEEKSKQSQARANTELQLPWASSWRRQQQRQQVHSYLGPILQSCLGPPGEFWDLWSEGSLAPCAQAAQSRK